jgi:hypothetical protein
MPRPFGSVLRVWNRLVDLVTGFSAAPAAPAEIERVSSFDAGGGPLPAA